MTQSHHPPGHPHDPPATVHLPHAPAPTRELRQDAPAASHLPPDAPITRQLPLEPHPAPTSRDSATPPSFDQYRAAMTQLGETDRVARVDERVEGLWADARQLFGAELDDQQYAALPLTVAPDLTAPADLDLDQQLDQIERYVRGLPPEQPKHSWWHSTRWVVLSWIAAALLLAIVLGSTVTGLTAIPAFVPPLLIATVLLLAGPGPVPGWIWAIGLAPLTLILLSGEPPSDPSPLPVPPPWFLGLFFVLLAAGFARGLQLAGRRRLDRRAERGRPVTRADELTVERRPLELLLTTCLFGAMTAGGGEAALIILTSIGALLHRRRWTSGLAALTALGMLLIAIKDARAYWGGDWAQPVVLAALTAAWVIAVFYEPWQHRLSRTERMMSIAGRTAAAGYRVTQHQVDNMVSSLTTLPPPTRPSAPAKSSKYPKGQFGRYCANCAGTTPHTSRGLSTPLCVQCGSRAAGGTRSDRNYPDYCSSCNGTTPHTSHGCVVCAGSR